MSNSLKFIAIYKLSTSKLINYAINEKSSEDPIKQESIKVATQIKSIGLHPQERQKINTNNGSWFCQADDQDVLYLVLAVTTYPERHAYGIVKEIQEELAKIGDYSSQDEASLKLHVKKPMNDLAIKFNDLASVDKIYMAQKQVDETAVVMEDNVKKMLKNQQDLDQLSNKADSMNRNAGQFAKHSSDLASIMYWRNMKLKIIMALIVIAGLLYICVPIIIKVAAST